jgi:hypothetical protein
MRFAVLIAFCAIEAALVVGQAQKNYKDRAEYDVYSEIAKDFAANNFSKALTDLERWSEKYPDSEFKEDRQILYVQAYAGTNQMAKVLDSAQAVLSNERLAGEHSASMLRALYAAVSAIQRVPDPSAQQLRTAREAADRLDAFDTPPEGVNAAAWESTRAGLRSAAKAALVYIAVIPAAQAVKSNDCGGGETAAAKAMEAFPESAQAAWYLALAEVCLAKSDHAKAPAALYELARAAAIDPGKGMVDAKWQQASAAPYLEKAYTQYHGVDPQGLKELKELAVRSPLPPPGFIIPSIADVAQEQQNKFETQHPEFALWMKIKNALSASDGERYFESDLKGSEVPRLQGILVAASPKCRPRELRIAIRIPADTQNPRAEILLKLETPLKGAPAIGVDLYWSAVATAFSEEPFLLTMETDPSKVEGLRLSPCEASQHKEN